MDSLAYIYLGYGAPQVQGELAAWLHAQEPTLWVRKGLLIAPSAPDLPAEALVTLARHYYEHPSYDTLPVLAAAHRATRSEWPQLAQCVPVLLVVREREVLALGSAQGSVRIVRGATAREILAPGALSSTDDLRLTGHWRLSSGDVLLAGERAALDTLAPGAVRRLGGGHRDVQAAADGLARSAEHRLRRAPALCVVRTPSLSAVPEMPVRPGEAPKTPPVRRPHREGASPILIALVMAAIAIGGSLWMQRAQLNRESIGHWLKVMFIPAPTPTLMPTPHVEPTATPEFTLIAPALLTPMEGESLSGQVTLRWQPSGPLPDGARYEVRLWRAGLAEERLTLTAEAEVTASPRETGWWQWRIQVVHVQEDEVTGALSSPSPARSFFWR